MSRRSQSSRPAPAAPLYSQHPTLTPQQPSRRLRLKEKIKQKLQRASGASQQELMNNGLSSGGSPSAHLPDSDVHRLIMITTASGIPADDLTAPRKMISRHFRGLLGAVEFVDLFEHSLTEWVRSQELGLTPCLTLCFETWSSTIDPNSQWHKAHSDMLKVQNELLDQVVKSLSNALSRIRSVVAEVVSECRLCIDLFQDRDEAFRDISDDQSKRLISEQMRKGGFSSNDLSCGKSNRHVKLFCEADELLKAHLSKYLPHAFQKETDLIARCIQLSLTIENTCSQYRSLKESAAIHFLEMSRLTKLQLPMCVSATSASTRTSPVVFRKYLSSSSSVEGVESGGTGIFIGGGGGGSYRPTNEDLTPSFPEN